MHKVLWDAIKECLRERSELEQGIERMKHCSGCPLGSECSELEELNE